MKLFKTVTPPLYTYVAATRVIQNFEVNTVRGKTESTGLSINFG